MAILDIITAPNPILKQVCEDVTVFDENLKKLEQDMFETMVQSNGIGLAAPQVGILKRMLIAGFEDWKITLINPEIESMKGEIENQEGCLSIPHVQVMVERAYQIVVKGVDVNNKPVKATLKDMAAVVVQHEMDHLNGILITDRGEALPLPNAESSR